jgi:DNA-binding GntR family transcriptional regulator
VSPLPVQDARSRMLVLDVCSSSGLEDWSPDLQKAKVYERILLDLILGELAAPLDLVELRQGYEARALIEPHCAGLAARHASKAEAQAIFDAFEGGEEAARNRDLPLLVAMDQRFHAAVARASQNLSLARILIPLQHKAARFWVFSFNGATEDELLADIEQHRDVARVIASRDVEGARAAMMRVLNVTPEAVQRPSVEA